MPEGLEVEIWRRRAVSLTGRTVTLVQVDPRVADPDLVDLVTGTRITDVGRRGKVLTLTLRSDALPRERILAIRFGMTGRLVVDGDAPIDRLEYASGRDRPEWDRLRLWTGADADEHDVPALRMTDPRRLGSLRIDPDLSALGVDVFDVDESSFDAAIAHRTAAVKTVLLDQSVIAGLGNLCADEVLFHSAISPHRRCDDLDPAHRRALVVAIGTHLPEMLARGGSTAGVLDPALRAGPGVCPLDGGALRRDAIGGRTAVWCPRHQR